MTDKQLIISIDKSLKRIAYNTKPEPTIVEIPNNRAFIKGALYILNNLVFNQEKREWVISENDIHAIEDHLAYEYGWNGSYTKPEIRENNADLYRN